MHSINVYICFDKKYYINIIQKEKENDRRQEKGIRANINKMVEERLGVLDKENDKVREKEENNKQRVANVAPGGIKHEKSVEHDKGEQDKGEIDI